MIEEHVGDLFAPDNQEKWDLVAHQVNARGAFGKGFAGAVKQAYPEAARAYQRAHRKAGWELGQILPVQVEPNRWIVHVCGQDDYGAGGPHTDYKALQMGLKKVHKFSQKKNLQVALPRLGCGLAGGEWSRVEAIIASIWKDDLVRVFSLNETG